MSETILDVRDGVPFDEAVIQRKTDPVAPNSFTPNDFAGQYPIVVEIHQTNQDRPDDFLERTNGGF